MKLRHSIGSAPWRTSLALLATFGACNHQDRGEGEGTLCAFPLDYISAEPVTQVDEGFVSGMDFIQIVADAPMVFHVTFPTDPCVENEAGSCEVTLEGDVLRVRSRASWDQESCEYDNDNSDVAVRCTTPELTAGDYTLAFGDATFDLRVPSMLCTNCFPQGIVVCADGECDYPDEQDCGP